MKGEEVGRSRYGRVGMVREGIRRKRYGWKKECGGRKRKGLKGE